MAGRHDPGTLGRTPVTVGSPSAPALRLAPTSVRSPRIVARAAAVLAGGLGGVEALTAPNGALGTVAGLGLVALAPALWRGRGRARMPALLLLALSSLAPLATTVEDGQLAVAVGLACLLLLGGRAFPCKGDPATRPVLIAGLVIAASAVLGDLARSRDLIHHPLIFTALVSTGVLLVVRALAPWRDAGASTKAERRLARGIVERYGNDTLSPFALRGDKRYFFAVDRDAVVAYRVVAGVALVSGDPIGEAAAIRGVLRGFAAYAEERGWLVAALGVGPQGLDRWRALGFRAHYTGEESIVEPSRFSLEGRSIRKVRQSVARLQRAGYRAEVLRTSEISDELAGRLSAIATAWRQGRGETGFSMAFAGDEVDREREDVYVIGYDGTGAPRGFLHLAAAPAGRAVSLSSMRRDRSAPNGLNEYLVCETIAWARRSQLDRVSLNFAAFAAILDPPGPVDRVTRLERRLLLRLSGRFQLERLRRFNEKFAPTWVPRYVVYPSRRSLPRVGLAAMIAEAYVVLPRFGRR